MDVTIQNMMAIRPVQDAPKKKAKRECACDMRDSEETTIRRGQDTKHVFGFGSFGSFPVQIKMFPVSHGPIKKSASFARAVRCDISAVACGPFFFVFVSNVRV
jgi:hypothetical protein